MGIGAGELARRLGQVAVDVCEKLLPTGHRQGRYWIVGDADGNPGRSTWVILESPYGLEGNWSDESTGDRGDLVDLIARRCRTQNFAETLEAARRFIDVELRSTGPSVEIEASPRRGKTRPRDADVRARRLWRLGRSIRDTFADGYLRNRAIELAIMPAALRYHHACYFRATEDAATEILPALLAAVTDGNGRVTAVNRQWLDPAGFSEDSLGKARVPEPKRALGLVSPNAVRFGRANETMGLGEGVETVLSVKSVVPRLPLAAGLTARHAMSVALAPTVRRLYLFLDNDRAGEAVLEHWQQRVAARAIELVPVRPELGDFNDDLRIRGRQQLLATLRAQLAREDCADTTIA
jgi:Toprim domain